MIYCVYNQISSFQHLSNSIRTIYCAYNQINNFEHLPYTIKEIHCLNNPCCQEYNFYGLNGIHKKNNVQTIRNVKFIVIPAIILEIYSYL